MVGGFGGAFAGAAFGNVIGQAVIEIVTDNTGMERSLTNTQRLLGGVAVAGFGAATVAALTYETAMAGVRKTTNANAQQMQGLNRLFREQSREIPMSASALANLGATAAQLGVEIDNLGAFTEVVAKLGTATNIVGEQGAQDLARFINVMGDTTQNVGRIGSAIVDLGNNSATTEAEILSLALRTAAAGRQLGFTTGDTLGLAAAMSSLGLESEAGGTAASRVLLEIYAGAQKGEKGVAGFAQVADMLPRKFLELVRTNPAEAFTAFVGGLATAEDRGLNVITLLDDLSFGNIRVRDALLRLSGAQDLMNDSMNRGNEAYAENTALQKEFELFADTGANQLKILGNQILNLGIGIGTFTVPALKMMIATLSLALDGFSALPEPVQATVSTMALLALGAVPLRIGLAAATTQVVALRGAFMSLTTVMLANPIAIAAVAAALIIGGFAWQRYSDSMARANREAQRAATIQSVVANQTADSIQQVVTETEDYIASLEAEVAALEESALGMSSMSKEYATAVHELSKKRQALAHARRELGTYQQALVTSTEQEKLAADAAAELKAQMDGAAAGVDDAALALANLNPQMVATAAAARLLSIESSNGLARFFALAQAVVDTASAAAMAAKVEDIASEIMAAAGIFQGGPFERFHVPTAAERDAASAAAKAKTPLEELAEQFDDFAARAPRSMAEVTAELRRYRAAAEDAGDATAVSLIDRLLDLNPTVQDVRSGISALQAQYGDLARKGEEAAERQKRAAEMVAEAWEKARAHTKGELDFLGDAIVTSLKRQADEQLQTTVDGLNDQRQAHRDAHTQRLKDIADQTKAMLAPLQAELDALDAASVADELAEIDRQVALAWDPQKRAELEQRRADVLQRIRRNEIRDQMQAIEDAGRQRELDAQTELDRLLVIQDGYEQDARKLHADTTEDWRLQAKARELILSGNLAGMTKLLLAHFPEWRSAGKGLGEQLMDGLREGIGAGVPGILGGFATTSGVGVPGVTGRTAVMQHAISELARAKAGGAPGFALAGLRAAFEKTFGMPAPLKDGGVITRPTFAYLGEVAQARPEIVSPERLMRRVVREEAGAGDITVITQTYLDGRLIDERVDKRAADAMGRGGFGSGVQPRRGG